MKQVHFRFQGFLRRPLSFSGRKLRGFTLLEALMAVALFGLLMLAVASLWNVSWRASERIRQMDAGGASVETVLKRLRQAVETSVFRDKPQVLYAWETKDDGGGNEESDELSFVTSKAPDGAEAYPEYAPLERMRVSIQRNSDGQRQLVLQVAPFTMEEGAWQRETVLLENVAAFRVRYWNKDRQQWEDGWNDKAQAPKAVQLGIALPGETIVYAQEVWLHQTTARVHDLIPVEVISGEALPVSSGTDTNAVPVTVGTSI